MLLHPHIVLRVTQNLILWRLTSSIGSSLPFRLSLFVSAVIQRQQQAACIPITGQASPHHRSAPSLVAYPTRCPQVCAAHAGREPQALQPAAGHAALPHAKPVPHPAAAEAAAGGGGGALGAQRVQRRRRRRRRDGGGRRRRWRGGRGCGRRGGIASKRPVRGDGRR